MRLVRLIGILGTVLTALASPSVLLAQSSPKSAHATRVGGRAPSVDGVLDDPAWSAVAPIRDFSQKVPLEGAEPSVATEVRLVYNGDALYVGARMHHPDPASIRTTLTRRDGSSDAERLVISLDTYLDRRTAYSFGVSAAGVRFDTFHPEDRDTGESQFDPVWTARVRIDHQGWTAEMRIPFTQLRFNAADPQVWGLEIARFIPERNEEIQWVMIPREAAGYASNFGTLNGIEGIRPSRRIEILPYAAGDLTLRSDIDPDDPFDQKTRGRAGADLKMGLGPNLTLDVTVNPDFGQVEADPAEVNLTAFETFFPERRPFFIEGSGMLDGQQGYITLPKWYYSRRIGAPPGGSADGDFVKRPASTTIASAAKITGRLASGLSVGALAAVTPREYARTYEVASGLTTKVPVEPASTYGVVRLQREVGRQQSAIGVVLTGTRRFLDDGDPMSGLMSRAAYTAGIDWKARLKDGMYELTGFVGGSRVEGDSLAMQRLQRSSARYFQRPDQTYVTYDPHQTSLSGYSAGVRADKNAGRWTLWGIGLITRSPGFEINDLGRMRSSDDIDFHADYQLRDTQPGKIFRFWQFGHDTQSSWSYGGVRRNSSLNQRLTLDFHNFWNFRYSTSRTFRGMSDKLTRGGPLMGTPSGWQYQARLTGNPGARIAWNAQFTYFHDELDGVAAPAEWRPPVPGWRPGGRRPSTWPTRGRWTHGSTSRRGTTVPPSRMATGTSSPTSSARSCPRPSGSTMPSLLISRSRSTRSPSPRAAGTRTWASFPPPRPGTCARTVPTERPSPDRLTGPTWSPTERRASPSATSTSTGCSCARTWLSRWEWAPGSTLYVIWQQNRTAFTSTGELIGVGSLGDAITAPGDNFLALKASYWIGLR